MPSRSLKNKRVLITQANEFMEPILCEVFAEHGAIVIAGTESLSHPDAASVVAAAGQIDILVANLAILEPTSPAAEA